MSMDGKGVVMRPSGLRKATRRAAERDSHKLKTRLCQGEKRNRKRMATVATVYSVAEHPRTAEQIMGLEERDGVAPRPRDKRVWASVGEREARDVAGHRGAVPRGVAARSEEQAPVGGAARRQ